MPNRNISEFFREEGVGTGENRAKIDENGVAYHSGSLVNWEDITGSLVGKSLSSVAGTVDYNWAENAIVFQPDGNINTDADKIIFNFQYPHAAVVDGEMRLHIHWEQTDAINRQFTVKYRIQKNGAAKTIDWTSITIDTNANNKLAYTSGTLNQITDLIAVDMTGKGLSSTVQFQLTRIDSEAVDLLATFVDAHVAKDTDGSRQEFAK